MTAISFGPDDGSAMRARLMGAFDCFEDVRGRSDAEVARLLDQRGIDIAVDLKGHTNGERLAILAHRPCAVQVQYLGYPGTLGAGFIDYVIADRIVLPFDRQPFFTEKIVHLPELVSGQQFPADHRAGPVHAQGTRPAGRRLCLLLFQQQLENQPPDFRPVDAAFGASAGERLLVSG